MTKAEMALSRVVFPAPSPPVIRTFQRARTANRSRAARRGGTLPASTSDAANGNVVLIGSSLVTARFLQVDLVSGSAAFIDIGGLIAGPLWRPAHAHAYGIAGSMSSGLMEFSKSGGLVKRLHLGRAAEGGFLAAALARGWATMRHGPDRNHLRIRHQPRRQRPRRLRKPIHRTARRHLPHQPRPISPAKKLNHCPTWRPLA